MKFSRFILHSASQARTYSSFHSHLIRILFFHKYHGRTYANILLQSINQWEYSKHFCIAFPHNRLRKYSHVENHLLLARDIRMVKRLNAIIERYTRPRTGIWQILLPSKKRMKQFSEQCVVWSCPPGRGETIDMTEFILFSYQEQEIN